MRTTGFRLIGGRSAGLLVVGIASAIVLAGCSTSSTTAQVTNSPSASASASAASTSSSAYKYPSSISTKVDTSADPTLTQDDPSWTTDSIYAQFAADSAAVPILDPNGGLEICKDLGIEKPIIQLFKTPQLDSVQSDIPIDFSCDYKSSRSRFFTLSVTATTPSQAIGTLDTNCGYFNNPSPFGNPGRVSPDMCQGYASADLLVTLAVNSDVAVRIQFSQAPSLSYPGPFSAVQIYSAERSIAEHLLATSPDLVSKYLGSGE